MIVKQDLVKRIKEYFNLNIYETKVWLALLSKGIASAGEVAELSSVPRSRTYDVLESLEKRGFAIIKIGKPVKYIAVKPTEIIEKMKSKTMNEAQEKVKSLSSLKETREYEELEELYKNSVNPIKSSELTGSIKGRVNISSRIREILENSQKEAVICTSVSDFEDKSRSLLPVIEKLAKKNVRIKVGLFGDSMKIRRINNKHGLKAKEIETDARFFIGDKKEVLFMITPENSEEDLGVWLNSPFFTTSLTKILDGNFR